MDSLIADGEILKRTEYIPFRYENSVVLTQKIWFGHGGIPLFSENIATVNQQLGILNAPVPPLFYNEKELFRITKRLLNRMRYFRSGIITLNVFAGESVTNFHLTAEASDAFTFPVSKQGIMLGFAEQVKFSKNRLSHFAFYNLPLWKTTVTEIEKSTFKNVVFLNENGFVTDCIGTNIFGVKRGELITPSIETGCYTDVLRSHIIGVSTDMSLKIVESATLRKEELVQMDEIFIASEASGIEWVMGIGNKRYVRATSDLIQVQLDQKLKDLAQQTTI
jgi:branched-chain amino acid aminotransferase